MTDAAHPLPRNAVRHVDLPTSEASGLMARLIIGIIVCAGMSVLLLATRDSLLGDPDTQWHIATGRWITENRAVPYLDTFSHTFAGQPWIAKEWLSQLALFSAYQAGGWNGVALLTTLCFAGSLGLLAFWLAQRLRSTLALVILAVVLFLVMPTVLARPHIIALPLMLVWILGMLNAVEQRRLPHWSMLPVMALWANAHAGFTIGFVIAGMLALEAVRNEGRKGWFRTALQWGVFLGLALAAACLSPYGPEAFIVTIKLFGSGEPLAFIKEWQPRQMDTAGLALVALVFGLLALLALNSWRNLFRIVLVALLGWMMLRYARFSLLFAFAAFPLVAAPLAWRFSALLPEAMAASRARLAQTGLAASALIIAVLLALPAGKPGPAVTPAAALSAARQAGLTGPVYNSYDFGGYLISQNVPTFIDGRTDQLFLGGFFRQHEETLEHNDPGKFAAFITQRAVTWALVIPQSREAQLLAKAGWVALFEDSQAIVLMKP